MRFMVMHKMTPAMEQGAPPDPEIIQGVGRLIQDGLKDKVFVSGEGLKPSSERVHIAYKNGKRKITSGPFQDPNELVGGFALMRVKSKGEAIAWCDRFAAIVGDIELFMGPVVEPWDIGLGPKPKNPPLRFLSLHQLDASAADAPPQPELMSKMAALVDEMTRAGVLQDTGGLRGTQYGARIHYAGKQRTIVDGPFAESKELVAGYAIVDLPSKAAAIDWTVRFGEVVKVSEIEIREIAV